MNRREIIGAADAGGSQFLDGFIAVAKLEEVVEADYEDEPGHHRVFDDGGDDDKTAGHYALDVLDGNAVAFFGQLVEALHLGAAEGGVDFGEAIVVAKALVGQPAHSLAALVAKGAARLGEGFIVGDDHSAFAGGDLLVGIKAE